MQLFLYFLKQSLSFMVCVSVAVTKDKKQTAKSSRPTKSSYHILAENVNDFLHAKKFSPICMIGALLFRVISHLVFVGNVDYNKGTRGDTNDHVNKDPYEKEDRKRAF